mgnify:CR=1 FL=1
MNVLILVIGKFNPCISSFPSPIVFDRGVFFDRKNWYAKDKFIFCEISIAYGHVPIVPSCLI